MGRSGYARGTQVTSDRTVGQIKHVVEKFGADTFAFDDGIVDFDRAFMHDIVTPDGRTVGQRLLPDVRAMLTSGKDAPMQLTFEQ